MQAGRSKPRGPYAKSFRRQADIIDKATEAFAQRGFAGTSLREIAAAVGMTQQGLSHHFASKEALLEAVLQRRDEASLEHYGSLGLSTADTLRTVVQDNLGRPGLVRLFATLAAEAVNPEHPAHAFFQDHYSSARSVFTHLVRRGQKDGEFRTDLPARQLAALLIAVFEGLQVQWLMSPEVDMAGHFEAMLQLLQPTRT